jgi:hypothetical protein
VVQLDLASAIALLERLTREGSGLPVHLRPRVAASIRTLEAVLRAVRSTPSAEPGASPSGPEA